MHSGMRLCFDEDNTKEFFIHFFTAGKMHHWLFFDVMFYFFLQIREQRDALEDWLDWIQEKEDVYMVTGTQASVAKNTIQIVGNTKKLLYKSTHDTRPVADLSCFSEGAQQFLHLLI